MKKINLKFLLLVAVAMIFVTACKKDEVVNEKIQKQSTVFEYSNEVNNFGKQFGLDLNAKIKNIYKGENKKVKTMISTLKTNQENVWDIDNSTTIEFETEEGVLLTSIAVPLLDNPNTMTCYVECNGKTDVYVVDYVFNEETQTMTSSINNEIMPLTLKDKTGWTSCMRGFFNSDIGVVVNVAGVAGALGCVACAGVAGFYTGVAALGCISAIR